MRIFLGYDVREAVGFHVCVQSIIDTTTARTEITPIYGERRDGTNDFIYARFLVPQACGYQGLALFIDGSDMLLREDITGILQDYDPRHAVSVVKHDYITRHPRKYLGTEMESDNRSYPRKNWSSVMLFNCGHPSNLVLTPEFVAAHNGADLHRFCWLKDSEIGLLDPKWNVLIGEDDDDRACALAHFTLGIPHFPKYGACRYSDEWFRTRDRALCCL